MPCTRSNAEISALLDIAANIELATSFIEGFDYERFIDDTRTFYAVTRCLEIISEASRKLPSDLKERHPSLPWRQIAGSGNIYRHDYDDVAHSRIWYTVNNALPALRLAVAAELEGGD